MTSVAVRDVVSLPVFRGTYVLGGAAGLDRIVSSVNVMEVPDIEAYISRGDLLLTTGYTLRERPERLVELLSTFADRGLGGLALTPLRYLGGLPDRLAEEADRLRFPVLVLPDGTSFNHVIGAVLAVVLAESGGGNAATEAIGDQLTGVALIGGGLEEIASILATALDREVLIVDELGSRLGHADRHAFDSGGAGRESRVNLIEQRTPWAFPITVAGRARGQILIGGDTEPGARHRRLIQQSCFGAGMHIAQVRAGIELDRRMRVLLLEELVSSGVNEPTLRQRSRLFGWDLTRERFVVLARCSTELADRDVHTAALRALGPGSLAWSRGHEVVAIVVSPQQNAEHALDDLTRRWRETLVAAGAETVTVAVGACAATAAQVPESHSTALQALEIAAQTGRQIVRFIDLDLERLLLAIPRSLLDEFATRKIGALVRQDAHDGSELCATLEAYLGLGNAAEAARKLFIHYNTMKHRLARISELAEVDLHDPRARLGLALALHIRSLTSEPGPRGRTA